MSNNPLGMVTLDSIIKDVVIEEGRDNDTALYQRYLAFAVRGVGEMVKTSMRATKQVFLEVNDLRQATLPTDYIEWLAVGRFSGGVFKPYIYAPRILNLFDTDDCGDEKPHLKPTVDENQPGRFNDTLPYRNGEFTGRFYGEGGGQDGPFFNVDRDRWNINFATPGPIEKGHTAVLIYETSGVACSGETTIHPYFKEPLIEWINWRKIKGDRTYNRLEKAQAKQDYLSSLHTARMAYNSFTLQDALNALRLHNRAAPTF